MQAEGRIADSQDTHLQQWDPESSLEQLSQEEARYSRGFLPANPQSWFSSFVEHWSPLFHVLSLEIQSVKCRKGFDFPQNLSHQVLVEIDGEKAVLALDDAACNVFAQVVVPGVAGVAADVVLEYLERRLLVTLSKSWTGKEALPCFYLGEVEDRQESAQLVHAAIELAVEVAGVPCSLWFGVGPRILERLDAAWRTCLLEENRAQGEDVLSDHIHTVCLELTELAVPPAMLIDYMRSGTLVDLEIPASSHVVVRVDGEPWADADLCQFNGRLAARIKSLSPAASGFSEGTTRVKVEISRTELDREGLLEHAQPGAVIVTDSPISTRASLIISGENVATAVVGIIAGNFALSVLPK